MKVRKLARAKNCAVFRDYAWPTTLPEFEDRVLIYGWNGSGKTTFASILREAETGRQAFPEGEWELGTDSAPIRSSAVPASLPIRVFDSEFVADSVFTTDERELAPVLYVGKGTRAKQERLEDCARELAAAEERVLSLAEAKLKAERTIDQFFADQAKLIKEALRSSESNPFNYYDKGTYRQRVQALAALPDLPPRLTDAERAQLRSAKDSRAMAALPRLGDDIAVPAELIRRVTDLVAALPPSASLERLTKDPAVGRWAEVGLQLHEERASQACLFCTAALRPDTLADLRRHFDRAFREMAQNIDALLEQMQLIRGRVESIEPPVSVQIATELRSQYEEELTAFARDRVEFTAALRSVEAGLLAKRNAPFTVVALDPAVATTLSLNMGRLNGILGKHNDEQGDLASRAAQARQVLADDLILQQWTRISHLQAQIHGVGEDLAEATQARDELRAEESVLQEEVVEHVSPAMELTAELAAFLGRDDITFLPSGTGYTITRSGVPAKGLSEGEKSAIALLYFLKTLKDRSFDRSGGVVVIDDPISSLDSNALFCALGYIQSEAEGIGQLIFLTHNFGFFREVRKWLIPVVGKPALPYAAYFMRCAGPCAARHVVLESLDDLLLNYDSEYQYLFKLVFAASNTTDRANIEQLFHYPNVARRLLEAFLAFRMPDISRGGLKGRLKQTNLDAAARERMLRFLDFQSHHDGIDVPEEDLSSLAEAPAVLQEVLNLMKDLDRPHFDRMCRVVAPHQIDQ